MFRKKLKSSKNKEKRKIVLKDIWETVKQHEEVRFDGEIIISCIIAADCVMLLKNV